MLQMNRHFAPLIALKGLRGSDNNEKSDGGILRRDFFMCYCAYERTSRL